MMAAIVKGSSVKVGQVDGAKFDDASRMSRRYVRAHASTARNLILLVQSLLHSVAVAGVDSCILISNKWLFKEKEKVQDKQRKEEETLKMGFSLWNLFKVSSRGAA